MVEHKSQVLYELFSRWTFCRSYYCFKCKTGEVLVLNLHNVVYVFYLVYFLKILWSLSFFPGPLLSDRTFMASSYMPYKGLLQFSRRISNLPSGSDPYTSSGRLTLCDFVFLLDLYDLSVIPLVCPCTSCLYYKVWGIPQVYYEDFSLWFKSSQCLLTPSRRGFKPHPSPPVFCLRCVWPWESWHPVVVPEKLLQILYFFRTLIYSFTVLE